MASSRHHREKRKIRAGAIIALFLIVIYGKANCCRTLLAFFQASFAFTEEERRHENRQRRKEKAEEEEQRYRSYHSSRGATMAIA